MGRYFEELKQGELVISPGRTVTEADVVNFAALSGDWNELHVNEEFARQGPFGRRIAHGALTFSISIGLLMQGDQSQLPNLIAFYGVDHLRFVRPVFLGDTIRLKHTVESLEPRDEKSGLLSLAMVILNQKEATVLSYTAKFVVHRRPSDAQVEMNRKG